MLARTAARIGIQRTKSSFAHTAASTALAPSTALFRYRFANFGITDLLILVVTSYHSFNFEATVPFLNSTPRVQGAWFRLYHTRPRKCFHELAKISMLTKI